MIRVVIAVSVSLAVHALIAIALVVGVDFLPASAGGDLEGVAEVELALDVRSEAESAAEPRRSEFAPDDGLEALTETVFAEAVPPPMSAPSPSAEVTPPVAVDPPEYASVSPPTEVEVMETPAKTPSKTPSAQPEPPTKRVRHEVEAKARKPIAAVYPRGALERKEQGNVELEFVVSRSGRVGDVRIVTSSGYSDLDKAAIKAVSTAQFVPAQADGVAVESIARLTLTFKLKKGSQE